MVETTELLLAAGASVTALDSDGNPPALSCAASDETATCLAMILAVYLANPTSETRKSLRSIGQSDGHSTHPLNAMFVWE